MPFPALAALLPYALSGAAGLAGSAIGSSLAGQGNNNQQSGGIGSKGNFLTGSPSQIHQLPRFSPTQIGQMNQLGQQGFQGLQGLNTSFEPIAQQARENFGQRGIPSIAERFTNAGGQRSSAFGQSLGQGAFDLESSLAALQSQHNLGQQDFFKNLLGLSLQPQFDTKIEAAAPGFGHSLAGGLGSSLPELLKLLAAYYGGKA